jgi:HK97 family phage prohead protease
MLRRYFETAGLTTREADGKRVISGRVITFDKLSKDLGGFRERVSSSALDWTLENLPVVCLHSHDRRQVIASEAAETLILKRSEEGLDFQAEMPGTTWGNDLLVSIDRGDTAGMSFGFNIRDNGAKFDDVGGQGIVTLTDIEMPEVSVTAFPAYNDTHVGLRDYLSCTGMPEDRIREIIKGGQNVPGQEPGADEASVACRSIADRRRRLALLEQA